jgi:ABC-type transport system substrate-binding protein/ABC-type dipeptide/oligopeptide/nickel transport system permease component
MLVLVTAVAEAGQGITVGAQLEPPLLDPTASAAAAIGEVVFPTVFEGLVQLGPDGGVEPLLARSWEISPDGLTYRFHLRSGVHFQDGAAFDADTVRFSLERAIGPGSTNPQKPLLACIDRVAVIDPETVDLDLNHPCFGLLQVLGWSAAVMVSPASAVENRSHPVGTGPFRFGSWRRGVAVDLVRNPDYWGPAPHLDRVSVRFIADPNAALDALATGDVDAFAALPAPESIARLRRDPRFTVAVEPSEAKTILAINNRAGPLADLRVRRALAFAIDRQAIIDAAMFGLGTPIGSHFAPTERGYVDLTGRYPHDPAKARALLAEAGYTGGLDLTLKLPPLAYARRSGEVVAAELAEIGVRVTLVPMEWVPWLDQVFGHHDFDLTIVAHVEPMDFGIYGRPDYYFGYRNPAFNALLDALDREGDETRRLDLLGDIQRQIAEDSVNVFLFDYPRLAVWDRRIGDLWAPTPVRSFDFGRARVDGGGSGDEPGTEATGHWIGAGLAVAGVLCLGLLGLAGPVFALRRLLTLLLTLAVASILVFALIQLAPGDPARFILGMNADPAALVALRAQLGLDQSFATRYLAWIGGLLVGDFGTSWTYHVPVGSLILERLALSLPLTLYALALSTTLALGLGLGAVLWRRTWVGRVLGGVMALGIAVPNFWVGILLVALFGVGLHWFSAGGFAGWQAGPIAALRSLTLPAIALALPQAAILARVLAGELSGALHQDYFRTARAKGLTVFQALFRHALPNALLPVLTILGMQFSFLLAGGVLVENAFFLPGLGRLVFQAITQRDLLVVEGAAMVMVFQVILVTLLADLACAAADPRLRRGSPP